MVFTHPTKTTTDFERDHYDCKQYVMTLAHSRGLGYTPFARGDMQRMPGEEARLAPGDRPGEVMRAGDLV
jgi:hypothetical protein